MYGIYNGVHFTGASLPLIYEKHLIRCGQFYFTKRELEKYQELLKCIGDITVCLNIKIEVY